MSSQDAAIGALHVIPQLPVGGAETLVFHMVRGLDRRRFAPRVCVLGELGPMGVEMERAGIEVTALEIFREPGRLVRAVRGLVHLIRGRGIQP